MAFFHNSGTTTWWNINTAIEKEKVAVKGKFINLVMRDRRFFIIKISIYILIKGVRFITRKNFIV